MFLFVNMMNVLLGVEGLHWWDTDSEKRNSSLLIWFRYSNTIIFPFRPEQIGNNAADVYPSVLMYIINI